MSEKRRGKRVRRRLVLRFGESELDHSGFTNDVSVNGLFIISGFMPPIDSRLHIKIDAGEGRHVFLEGVVARQKRVPTALMRSGKGGFAVRLLTTSELILSTSKVLRQNAARIQEGAASPTIDVDKLKEAFANVRATIDGMADYRIKALSSMERTVDSLNDEVGKAKAYLETRRAVSG